LNFIGYAFGTGGYPLGYPGGLGGLDYPCADWLAMGYTQQKGAYSLSDFFNFGPAGFHSFQSILGAKYGQTCFKNPNQTGCFPGTYPQDPDNDASE